MRFSTSLSILALAASTVSARGRSPHCVCCSALAQDQDLQGKVYSKDNSFYNARLETYYSANAAQAPWCMVLPESTSDVTKIAKILNRNQCPFGIRSGAHSAFTGSNGVKKGVTIDFGYMNTTTYDEGTKIASIQPGSDWERVFSTLDPYGVAAVGGRASVVGVGGFTTGGGYSFHTNSHGFACDSVTNFEVVLGDGSVVNANANEHPDLWKALKGGSGNFGFVTRIDARTVDSTQMSGGFVSYNLTERDNVFNAYLNFANNMDNDLYSQNIVALYYDKTGLSLRSILTNVQANMDAPAFDEYYAIPNISSTVRVGTVAELVPEFTGPTPLGLYANWMVGQTTNDFHIMDFIDTKLKEYSAKMKEAAPESDFNVLVQFQPVTQSIVKHGLENGGNSLGLESVVADGPTIMWLIALTVDTPANQKLILPFALEFRAAIDEYAKEIEAYKEWKYLNYAWKDQDPLSTHGEDTINCLKSVAEKYDPEHVFQNLRKTGFKLPA
ncbi:FAD binding domain-containing protein [Colletotrichum phormii]|uniref:FAD binding domain-containing protein n=1 Tax=Colletotrichum phormii TaxID=359342 RepID=A0AAI9ZM75_9PEZI|nr:FAD binding domain-containing protein [Colletotrichum phormii]KAK1634572.1 FAD binding domain-containing protein [Colletotrichum phormii]